MISSNVVVRGFSDTETFPILCPFAEFSGPPGDKGPPGIKGKQGAKGKQGLRGLSGSVGIPGLPGFDADETPTLSLKGYLLNVTQQRHRFINQLTQIIELEVERANSTYYTLLQSLEEEKSRSIDAQLILSASISAQQSLLTEDTDTINSKLDQLFIDVSTDTSILASTLANVTTLLDSVIASLRSNEDMLVDSLDLSLSRDIDAKASISKQILNTSDHLANLNSTMIAKYYFLDEQLQHMIDTSNRAHNISLFNISSQHLRTTFARQSISSFFSEVKFATKQAEEIIRNQISLVHNATIAESIRITNISKVFNETFQEMIGLRLSDFVSLAKNLSYAKHRSKDAQLSLLTAVLEENERAVFAEKVLNNSLLSNMNFAQQRVNEILVNATMATNFHQEAVASLDAQISQLELTSLEVEDELSTSISTVQLKIEDMSTELLENITTVLGSHIALSTSLYTEMDEQESQIMDTVLDLSSVVDTIVSSTTDASISLGAKLESTVHSLQQSEGSILSQMLKEKAYREISLHVLKDEMQEKVSVVLSRYTSLNEAISLENNRSIAELELLRSMLTLQAEEQDNRTQAMDTQVSAVYEWANGLQTTLENSLSLERERAWHAVWSLETMISEKRYLQEAGLSLLEDSMRNESEQARAIEFQLQGDLENIIFNDELNRLEEINRISKEVVNETRVRENLNEMLHNISRHAQWEEDATAFMLVKQQEKQLHMENLFAKELSSEDRKLNKLFQNTTSLIEHKSQQFLYALSATAKTIDREMLALQLRDLQLLQDINSTSNDVKTTEMRTSSRINQVEAALTEHQLSINNFVLDQANATQHLVENELHRSHQVLLKLTETLSFLEDQVYGRAVSVTLNHSLSCSIRTCEIITMGFCRTDAKTFESLVLLVRDFVEQPSSWFLTAFPQSEIFTDWRGLSNRTVQNVVALATLKPSMTHSKPCLTIQSEILQNTNSSMFIAPSTMSDQPYNITSNLTSTTFNSLPYRDHQSTLDETSINNKTVYSTLPSFNTTIGITEYNGSNSITFPTTVSSIRDIDNEEAAETKQHKITFAKALIKAIRTADMRAFDPSLLPEKRVEVWRRQQLVMLILDGLDYESQALEETVGLLEHMLDQLEEQTLNLSTLLNTTYTTTPSTALPTSKLNTTSSGDNDAPTQFGTITPPSSLTVQLSRNLWMMISVCNSVLIGLLLIALLILRKRSVIVESSPNKVHTKVLDHSKPERTINQRRASILSNHPSEESGHSIIGHTTPRHSTVSAISSLMSSTRGSVSGRAQARLSAESFGFPDLKARQNFHTNNQQDAYESLDELFPKLEWMNNIVPAGEGYLEVWPEDDPTFAEN